MKVSFPVFLKDTDRCMVFIKSIEHLNSHIEMIDVEDKEYTGWDVNGHKIELRSQGKSIEVHLVENTIDIEGLKSSLLFYSNNYLKQNFDLKYFESHTLESIFQYESRSNMFSGLISWLKKFSRS